MQNLPPLKTLKAFSQAAMTGSFTAAAERLHVTHSAVSHQLRQLELWLGCKLFVRTASGVTLTEPGRTLYTAVAQSFDLLEHTCAALRHEQNGSTLTLACPGSFMLQYLIPRLHDFEQRHPYITLNLQMAKDVSRLDSKQADALLYCGRGITPDRITEYPLMANEIGPVCSPMLAKNVNTASDLQASALLGTRSYPGAWAVWAQTCDVSAERSSVIRNFDQFIYMIQAAVAGLGIGIVPSLLVQAELADGRLVAPLGFVDIGDRISLWVHKNNAENPQLPILTTWLEHVLKSPLSGISI